MVTSYPDKVSDITHIQKFCSSPCCIQRKGLPPKYSPSFRNSMVTCLILNVLHCDVILLTVVIYLQCSHNNFSLLFIFFFGSDISCVKNWQNMEILVITTRLAIMKAICFSNIDGQFFERA